MDRPRFLSSRRSLLAGLASASVLSLVPATARAEDTAEQILQKIEKHEANLAKYENYLNYLGRLLEDTANGKHFGCMVKEGKYYKSVSYYVGEQIVQVSDWRALTLIILGRLRTQYKSLTGNEPKTNPPRTRPEGVKPEWLRRFLPPEEHSAPNPRVVEAAEYKVHLAQSRLHGWKEELELARKAVDDATTMLVGAKDERAAAGAKENLRNQRKRVKEARRKIEETKAEVKTAKAELKALTEAPKGKKLPK
ncbi:MAG: hypothetical protein AAF799_20225 [Myxococcota bacterium]